MTNDEIRIAVAEACGCSRWVRPSDGRVFLCVVRPNSLWTTTTSRPIDVISSEVPEYPIDLNACKEMLALLTDNEWPRFIIALEGVTKANGYARSWMKVERLLKAEAVQFCEAFLRVKGLWKEEKP